MNFYIKEPVVNMRENPSHASKVVSQALLSEKIILIQPEGEWSKIQTPDKYTGWIPTTSFALLDEPYESNFWVNRLSAHIYHVKDIEFGPLITLPYGSKVKVLDSDHRWMQIVLPNIGECYIQKGDVASQSLLHKSELVNFSQNFMGLPYTWGGRSSFGFDCSGFVQFLYQKIGIDLPRDSKDQIQDSRFQTINIDQLEEGDLIFFGKGENKIMHVGMSIGNGRFIHATSRENQPWIRISHVSDSEWNGNSSAYYPYRQGRKLLK